MVVANYFTRVGSSEKETRPRKELKLPLRIEHLDHGIHRTVNRRIPNAPVLKRSTANGLEFLGTPLADEQITETTGGAWINSLQCTGRPGLML
jgi:hypothetical protein